MIRVMKCTLGQEWELEEVTRMRKNIFSGGTIFVGNVMFVSSCGGEFASLNDSQVEYIKKISDFTIVD